MLASFSEYQELAGVTRKADDPPALELAHYALGMVGEAGEVAMLGKVSEDEWLKEIGDCFWYAAGVCSVVGFRLSDVLEVDCQHTRQTKGTPVHVTVLSRLLTSAAAVCELAKKSQFYGKEIPFPDLREQVAEYLLCLIFLCDSQGFNPLWVCSRNIDKLQARYGGKFDAAKAKNRDLSAEHAAVQS